jgi:hypothetical protein
MRTTSLFAAAAAALILYGVGGWVVASTPHANAAIPSEQIDIMQLTMNAKDMPAQHFHDMAFVFD